MDMRWWWDAWNTFFSSATSDYDGDTREKKNKKRVAFSWTKIAHYWERKKRWWWVITLILCIFKRIKKIYNKMVCVRRRWRNKKKIYCVGWWWWWWFNDNADIMDCVSGIAVSVEVDEWVVIMSQQPFSYPTPLITFRVYFFRNQKSRLDWSGVYFFLWKMFGIWNVCCYY